jgi:hypothetical protein
VPEKPASPSSASVWRQRPLRRILKNWLSRHRHPFNRWIHFIGIPMAVAGVVLFCCGFWWWGLGAFVVGYLLQYLGHLVEGNDLGEWAAIKRLFGLPYVSIAPCRNLEESGQTQP